MGMAETEIFFSGLSCFPKSVEKPGEILDLIGEDFFQPLVFCLGDVVTQQTLACEKIANSSLRLDEKHMHSQVQNPANCYKHSTFVELMLS